MICELKMPRLDEDMFEGTVTRWLKKEGDSVQKGEPVVEIETQKVNFEVEAPGSGILRIILAQEGDLLPINSVMAVIAEPEEDISSYQKLLREKKETSLVSKAEPAPISPVQTDSFQEMGRIPISPVAKKIALERGLNITQIQGTGPGGRITKEDILHFQPDKIKPSTRPRPQIRQVLPLSGTRKTIADRLTTSWQSSPRAEHFITVDITEFVNMREEAGETWERKHGVKPSVNDLVIAAAAKALRAFPTVNAALQNGRIEIYEDVNVSVAVALEKGLITPVIRQADTRDVFAIAREAQRLVDLVRKGEHSRDTLSGSTFTVTNLGMFDVDFFVPVINPPESAILSVGKIERKPLVIEETIAIRSVMCLCLAFDHRVLDGAIVARFLQNIKRTLENPKIIFREEE
jgi:pyruvate dehydrogenase E2 component (dihydrolipoamide acetyltransferase)